MLPCSCFWSVMLMNVDLTVRRFKCIAMWQTGIDGKQLYPNFIFLFLLYYFSFFILFLSFFLSRLFLPDLINTFTNFFSSACFLPENSLSCFLVSVPKLGQIYPCKWVANCLIEWTFFLHLKREREILLTRSRSLWFWLHYFSIIPRHFTFTHDSN